MARELERSPHEGRNGRVAVDEQESGEVAERVDDGFSVGDSEALASEAARSRGLDRALAKRLGQQPAAAAEPISQGHIHELGERERLPAPSEQRLVLEAIGGDRRARAELVETFLPLIATVARNYRASPHITRSELMQEGVVGLLRALERYDPTVGAPFWAYASWWVRQAMQQLVAELTRPVVMSDRALRHLSQIKDAHGELQRDRQTATIAEISERTRLDASQVANLIAADRPPRALEEPIEGEEAQIGTFGELIADPLAEDEYEQVITSIASRQVRDLLSSLSDRERTILSARFGLEGNAETLRDVARRLGVSAERVRQLETQALGKLRAAAAGGQRGDD